ncbi:MAG: PQQ-binding-like beta-propeller repeat protein [Planctomycetota bacterium]
MRNTALHIFSFLMLALFVCEAALAQQTSSNWPHWRGPEQNGISRELNLLDDWSFEEGEDGAQGKNLAWVSYTGGRATPIILNGRVFLNCRTPEDFTDPEERIHSREQVICWDLKTGEVIWNDKFNVFQTDIASPRVGWASMVGDEESGNVFMHSVSGLLRCYSPDGDVVWERSLWEDYGKISGYGGRTQTPIIDENRVIVSFLTVNWGDMKGPGPLHYYYAFDKNSGELLWISAPGEAPKDTNYSVPIVRVINGQRLLIGGNGDGSVCALNARTGAPVWRFRMSERGLNSTPVVDDAGRVFIAHGEDNIDNVDFGRVQCIDGTLTGDITNSGSVWRFDGLKAGYTALLEKDGVVYVVSDPGNLHAFDGESGEMLWEYNLGTVGKGSPVWADGKLYVMEVNGNIHILKADRAGCEEVSLVNLKATNPEEGIDEITASPAISQGHVVFVTRDRTICVTDSSKEWEAGELEPLADEAETGAEVASVHLYPYEVILGAGESQKFELHKFDANGCLIGVEAPTLEAGPGMEGEINGDTITMPAECDEIAGTVVASVGDVQAQARIRCFNSSNEWSWDFEGFTGIQVPPTWIRAHVKMKPFELEGGGTVMRMAGMGQGKGRPSHTVLLGSSDMTDYVIQADVMMSEQKRQMPSIGLLAGRYNFLIAGNTAELAIWSWAPTLRMAQVERFRSDPDVWYTVKMKVEVTDEEARVYGKVWQRDEDEPEEWTMEAVDPYPNPSGSPGLYVYAQADCFFDNVKVTFDE